MTNLKFVIPTIEDPSELGDFELNFYVPLVDAVLTGLEIVGVELGAAGMLASVATGPLAAAVGSWFALGEGYAQAWAEIANREMKSGFCRALAMACHGRKGTTVVQYFGHDYFSGDQQTVAHARQGRAAGLKSGYLQGAALSASQKKLLLRDLEVRSGHKWSRSEINSEQNAKFYYVDLGTAFMRYHLRGN